MLLPSFLVTTFICFTRAAEQNVTADVELFLAKFRELNDTMDVLDTLERIGEHTRELFRLGYPLRALLKEGVNMTDEDSEETKAVLELRKAFSWEEFYSHHDENTFSATIYLHAVYQKTLHLEYMVDAIGYSSFKSTLKTYRNLYGLDNDALGVIGGIDSIARLNCPMPEKEGIKRLAKIQEALRFVDGHVYKGQSDSEWNSFKRTHLTPVFVFATDYEVDSLIGNLTQVQNATHEIVVESAHNWTRLNPIASEIFSSCLMELSNAGSDFNQIDFLSRISKWHRDILRSVLSKWVMSVTVEPDEESYYRDGEITTIFLERTAHFIAKWTRQYQKVSWPEIGIEKTKDVITFNYIPIDAFNETARKVQKIFEESGSQSYSYQVLVVSTSEVDVSWSVGTERIEDYTNITNYNGVDIHIFRYNRTESSGRSQVVKKTMNYKKDDILNQMRLVSSRNPNSSTKNDLSYFQNDSAAGPVNGKDFYRSVILLKHNGSSESKESDIPVGLAAFENASFKLETSRTSYSVHQLGKENIFSFKMFFFL